MAAILLPGGRKQIQTEFVIPQLNLTRLETSSDQDRPEIAFAVIHFVIVHLHLGTEPEPESRNLQEPLSNPCRNVDKQQPRRLEQPPRGLDGKTRVGQMFQDR